MSGDRDVRSLASVQQEIARAAEFLKRAGVRDPSPDARRLMAAALKIERDRLTLHMAEPIASEQQKRFDAFCAARAARMPVSRILSGRQFYGRWFNVTAHVLDPRPETETLIEAALTEPFDTLLDLGTGSGAIALSLVAERAHAQAAATDISPLALETAAENAASFGVADRVQFTVSDWFQAVAGRFDLIVSNPPYIAASEIAGLEPEVRDNDPLIALSDSADGLSGYREIARGAPEYLNPGGRLLVEIGATQAGAVTSLFEAAGLCDIRVLADLDGRDRVVAARA